MHRCIDARRPTTRKMRDRMFSSNRVFASERFECRRCRGATCTQGLTGLRGPLAMPSRSHEARGRRGGSGFEFFPSQYRSWPSTSYSFASCNYTRSSLFFFFFFYNSSSKPSLNSSSTTMLPDTVINIARTKARTLKLKPQDKTLHRFLRCEDREIRENAEQLRLLAVKVEFREQSLIRSRSRGNIVR